MNKQERIDYCLDYAANILEYQTADNAYNFALIMALSTLLDKYGDICQFDERGE